MTKTEKLYPDSGIELSSFTSKHYDTIMNIVSFGSYRGFIKKAISDLDVQPGDKVLDMGCGTGRNILLMNKSASDQSSLIGMDISENMERQFHQKCKDYQHIKFINKRIDQPFQLDQSFDKVLTSFVIHGFPQEIRKNIISNAYNNLEPGGVYNILDWAEFDMTKMPFHHRLLFKKIECSYAFEYIENDWKAILEEHGFGNFRESFYLMGYIRLLKAEKIG